jgi:hypothetical protein
MNWINSNKIKDIAFVLITSMILLLLTDAIFGDFILKHAPIISQSDSLRGLRIKHPTYHHTLSSNYDGYAKWGDSEYRFCTNQNGMKSKCDEVTNDKQYDLAFLGDSFTEGIGQTYEKTFVGLIATKLSPKKIANLAVASYSPTIYYLKLKESLDKGYKFKELIVYIDISDIQDESNYIIKDGKVVDTSLRKIHKESRKNKKRTFPMLSYGLKGIKARLQEKPRNISHRDTLDLTDAIYQKTYKRSAWTFDSNVTGYGVLGVDGSIKKSLFMMNQLYELCKKNNIQLSVGVYPWPAQILFDVKESRQVKIWQEFCNGKCKKFYNSFPTLFQEVKFSSKQNVINNYYYHGDFHFNEKGNELIANDFIANYQNN